MPSGTPSTPGDGFTPDEVRDALNPPPAAPWQPQAEYAECSISDLQIGPHAVTFMGRVANIFDVTSTPKTERSAKGCVKLCVKDDEAAVTVRLWYAKRLPNLRLGALVSIWTNHVSNGERGNLSSLSAPLFVSLFPERDRSCHLMVHENSDDGSMCKLPLGFSEGRPLNQMMTLRSFIDGGHEVLDAKILVVVKSISAKKKVSRKDGTMVDNINLHVQDDTAQAMLSLWGTAALSPNGFARDGNSTTNPDAAYANESWWPNDTIILLQSPSCKLTKATYLSLTSTTIIDINPSIPDTAWLRRWSHRQHAREAINPPFPVHVPFSAQKLLTSPLRPLYCLADLDELGRSPNITTTGGAAIATAFQGLLSVLISQTFLVEHARKRMLFAGECCNLPLFANDLSVHCAGCEKDVSLRLNPRILGPVIDETGVVAQGKLLVADQAWGDLLGRGIEALHGMGREELKGLDEDLAFRRVTVLFGWSADETVAGGRICVMGFRD